MKTLRVILGDQLSHSIATLTEIHREHDTVFMCEVHNETTYVKHHKKKIAFIFSAMRHFAEELRDQQLQVHYTKLTDPDNAGNFTAELERYLMRNPHQRIVITHPGEYRVLKEIESWSTHFGIAVNILEDTRFYCAPSQFNQWATGKKKLIMEFFYRQLRTKHHILMIDNQPIGGKWNFDADNRKIPPSDLPIPVRPDLPIDAITEEVLNLVDNQFSTHFGELYPFNFAVTRKDALKLLDHFIEMRLPFFGDYQDAMIEGEPWLFHSHISFYLNCGLLLPKECVMAAEEAYHLGKASLNCVEGFIRQIVGWREYIRGIYWLKMPDYALSNGLTATRPLPELYWTGKTSMNCLHQCVKETKQNAYAHHIQRLMVLGNFALLTGVDPKEVNEWFLIVYADAYEWVELPNVTGMILYADEGLLASKPYAASGSYINKMSNYCKNCQFNVKLKSGPDACPFNYLYWNFLIRHKNKLQLNPRLAMVYHTLNKIDKDVQLQYQADANHFLATLSAVYPR